MTLLRRRSSWKTLKLYRDGTGKIVFYASGLEYISSAGLRVIIFAKQKIGAQADIYLAGAQEAVREVISMSGLDNFLTITDKI